MRKNYNKIPPALLLKIETLASDEIEVCVTKNISLDDITSNKYRGFNFQVDNGMLSFNNAIIPNRIHGRYSKKNIDGYKITYRDQEKVSKTFYLGERPIWGDWTKGAFSLYATRMVYPSDFIPPRELAIKVEMLEQPNEQAPQSFNIRFFIDMPLNREDGQFEEDLLFLLNLLQENVYGADVFAANATMQDYLNSLAVNWEIFPPGTKEDDIRRITEGLRNLTIDKITTLSARYDFLMSLKPQELIVGSNGMRRYFGVKFSDNLVVFENLNYGNAIYVLFENWAALSQLSRTEIQDRPSDQFICIKHMGDWMGKVRQIIKARMER
jgi:hypothetical protein